MRKTHRSPLEQRAYLAWRDLALTKKPGDDESDFWKAWADHAAVKEGRASPLPQYRETK